MTNQQKIEYIKILLERERVQNQLDETLSPITRKIETSIKDLSDKSVKDTTKLNENIAKEKAISIKIVKETKAEITKRLDKEIVRLEKSIREIELIKPKDGKDGYTPIKGKDYFDGKDGKDGKSINGKDGLDGKTPIKGKDYFDGKDGKNIKGDKGDDGLSAYEIAVSKGYKKSEKEWLESLKGEKGSIGLRGGSGTSAYQLAVQGGYTGTLTEFTTVLSQMHNITTSTLDADVNLMADGDIWIKYS